jgi:hypothetical protein
MAKMNLTTPVSGRRLAKPPFFQRKNPGFFHEKRWRFSPAGFHFRAVAEKAVGFP